MSGEFNPEEFMSMSAEEEEQMLMGGEGVPETTEPPAQAVATTPPAGQEGAPDPAATQQQQPADRGDTSVPIGALRAQNRELAQQNAQLMGMLQAMQQHGTQPQGGAAQAPQQGAEDDGPRFAIEDPEQIARAIENHPVVREAAQAAQMFKGMMAQQQQQIEMQELMAINPDAPGILAEFDAAVPDYAHLPAKVRYYLADGILKNSPDYQQQQQRQTAEQARELAISSTADALRAPGSTTPGAPPSIASLPNAQPNQQALPQGDLNFGQWSGLNDDQEEALLGKGLY